MYVTWKDALRPMPDKLPAELERAAWDMGLVIDRSGEVVGKHRTFWGTWIFLVLCDDGELREIEARKANVSPNQKIHEDSQARL